MKKNKLFNKTVFNKSNTRTIPVHAAMTCVIALLLGISAGILSYSQVLRTPDEYVTNYIYTYNPFSKADDRITLISIDSDTTDKYGDYSNWDRSLLSEAVDILSDNDSAAIALDVDLSENKTTEGDAALVSSCKEAGNVIAIADASFDTHDDHSDMSTPEENPGSTEPHDSENIEAADDNNNYDYIPKDSNMNLAKPADSSMDWSTHSAIGITFPYDDLRDVVTVGISNAMQQSDDGSIRSAALTVNYDSRQLDSFASLVYSTYQKSQGLSIEYPSLDNNNLFGFNTITNFSSYNIISFKDLLSGNYSASDFNNKIVMIGELSDEGKDEPYFKFINSDYMQQDITTQASIIQALLNNTIKIDVSPLFSSILYAVLIFILYLATARRKSIFTTIFYVASCICTVAVTDTIYQQAGYRFLLLIPLMYNILSIICSLMQNLLYTTYEKRKMENTFKMYVDSHVVDQISDIAPLELASVSMRKKVAVLFVDIRGFTSISESLEPEEVVEVLNEYFSIVYASIMAWNGTLDKFIGDAAMAIFNAPDDLDDYIFNAVCAADDIMKGFIPIRNNFRKKFNRDINLGIGINSGDAIVGNIGCYGRYDYTAIGDTVNTASRLESNAKPGQILISSSVFDNLQGRIDVSHIGALSLKGKSSAVEAYMIESITKPDAPNDLARKGFLHELHLLYTKAKPTR